MQLSLTFSCSRWSHPIFGRDLLLEHKSAQVSKHRKFPEGKDAKARWHRGPPFFFMDWNSTPASPPAACDPFPCWGAITARAETWAECTGLYVVWESIRSQMQTRSAVGSGWRLPTRSSFRVHICVTGGLWAYKCCPAVIAKPFKMCNRTIAILFSLTSM